ncbi:hypothetical protein CCR75_000352 [Bremia lactucae]|uniref:Uncharacterized protein n=1 Tax=Bremia lactucae TaxID=4779 RepID=A0A976FP34_BRELC|nr:hypothetical protein CCR75_000352 [Bremia lactucae]
MESMPFPQSSSLARSISTMRPFVASASTSSDAASAPESDVTTSPHLPSRPSCEWSEWEETFDSLNPAADDLASANASLDLELDEYLLATAEDFLEPFANIDFTPDSPILAADQTLIYDQKHYFQMLQIPSIDTSLGFGAELHNLEACKDNVLLLSTDHTMHSDRKRKRAKPAGETNAAIKLKRSKQFNANIKSASKVKEAEIRYQRRYNVLHRILEAWNTGGIEDIEEIANSVYEKDVTLISPDISEGLHGLEAVLSHWNLLLDAFPDGIMEEYVIQREGCNEELLATWTFSGTQIYPFLGVQPRHEKICISGKSLFTFEGDKIRQMVLSWNHRETLLLLMGVQPDKPSSVVFHKSARS